MKRLLPVLFGFELQQRLGLTVVYVKHDQSDALAISDSVVVMKQGCIVQSGGPQELYQRPREAFGVNFLAWRGAQGDLRSPPQIGHVFHGGGQLRMSNPSVWPCWLT